MSKRTILILSIIALVLIIIGYVLIGAGASASSNGSAAAGIGIGGIILFAGGLVAFVNWILGMVKTATIGRWGWFVVVLLLGGAVGSLIYGLAGPEHRNA